MTKEAFKRAFARGFAEQVAERGWTPSEIEAVLVKTSWLPSYAGISENVRAILGDAKSVSKAGLILGGGIGALAGGIGGYLAADPQRVSDADLDAMRDQDLIAAYRQALRGLRLPSVTRPAPAVAV